MEQPRRLIVACLDYQSRHAVPLRTRRRGQAMDVRSYSRFRLALLSLVAPMCAMFAGVGAAEWRAELSPIHARAPFDSAPTSADGRGDARPRCGARRGGAAR